MYGNEAAVAKDCIGRIRKEDLEYNKKRINELKDSINFFQLFPQKSVYVDAINRYGNEILGELHMRLYEAKCERKRMKQQIKEQEAHDKLMKKMNKEK